ncbi:LysR family transcriptional regulator [Klebsiella huaxiensis]|uniref:LysR family transcriptional regulator n=1 Tax=Klebsiella huaxiensis TaxID=2153354 RepID=A0A564GQD0_9ENTR|nr:LysR family transcriptional regulator [Klebsiella huaxiensis]MDG1642122.1 LysR family transcriptional regulator [Klebsiella huaxiensis]QBG09335.1 LysR family transcriptional regulator [Klebsiella huaxiensis]VUS22544.1 putative HTH-type transcriptional regulator YbdO [Klebsiella huaxiensis]VUS76086.1 putative HTH-type transcriptional regulator YbdO [Klebsiella huaxiensis]
MANLYDLKKFDLNLLVIFECIYQNLSISKAAETLFITPSAVSQSLQRLRNQLNDPLFVRSGKGITPTTVGVNLHHHLEKNLNQLEQTINITNRSELRKRLVVYAPQLFITPKTTNLIHMLLDDSNIHVEHHDLLASGESVESLLSYRKADLIFSTSSLSSRATVCKPIQELDISLICNENHPRVESLTTTKAILQESFTYYLSNDLGAKSFQSQAAGLLVDRKISFSSDSYIAILNVIQQTNLIGFVPTCILEHISFNNKLKIIDAPFKIPTIMIYMLYNRVNLDDPNFMKFINDCEKNNIFA